MVFKFGLGWNNFLKWAYILSITIFQGSEYQGSEIRLQKN